MVSLKQRASLIFFLIRIMFDKNEYYSTTKSQSQNQESEFLVQISSSIKNKIFVEFGFHYAAFNCIGLIREGFSGLLIDGDPSENTLIMKMINRILRTNINVRQEFLSLDNIELALQSVKEGIGVLSIDVDGNDYHLLKEILSFVIPEVIVVEYNASLLDSLISVPYDKNFVRHVKHDSGWYHGASLSAFSKLLSNYGYSLVRSIGGLNAFFVNESILSSQNLDPIAPEKAYTENILRNIWSGTNAQQQFQKICHLPFDRV
jgi:hypothetical protein